MYVYHIMLYIQVDPLVYSTCTDSYNSFPMFFPQILSYIITNSYPHPLKPLYFVLLEMFSLSCS